jgi:delta-aminolevulinic acid dehydratase/porphobilinogen synthase
MLCFKRAGANGIFTYFAPKILNLLSKNNWLHNFK